MTTDIAILSPKGVAVATDSAITTLKGSESNPRRVHYSAEKLFHLDPAVPVAVMLYGQNDLMGIPMSVWIKAFRERSIKRCETLEEYGEQFFSFLRTAPIEEHLEIKYLIHTCRRVFLRTRVKHQQAMKKRQMDNAQPTETESNELLEARIREQHRLLESFSDSVPFSTEQFQALSSKNTRLVSRVIDDVFGETQLSEEGRQCLKESGLTACAVHPDKRVGLVFTGYGEEEYLPSLRQFDLKGLWGGQLIYREEPPTRLGSGGTGVICSFGQSADVNTFLDGISPNLSAFFEQTLQTERFCSLHALEQEINEHLDLPAEQVTTLMAIVSQHLESTRAAQLQRITQYKLDEFRKPILDALRVLPEPQLVAMARTLVKLVSFRQQVSMESETVGGPIDVAFLGKGDGFRWVKQKSPLSDVAF